MSKILTKDELEEKIWEYYIEHYGEDEGDVWFDPPAVNVRTFLRDIKYISEEPHSYRRSRGVCRMSTDRRPQIRKNSV